jgi:hypothetical protein
MDARLLIYFRANNQKMPSPEGEGAAENRRYASNAPNRPHLSVSDCYGQHVTQLSTAPAAHLPP